MSGRYAAMPGSGYPPTAWGPPAARSANPVGIVVAIVGGALSLIGTLVEWYSPGSVTLQDIIRALDAPGAKAFPKAYFGWLMWVVLALTVVAALFANVAGPLSTPMRVASPVLGALGAILVCVSLGQLISGRSILDQSGAGLWLVLGGFIVAGLAGVLGPRRARGPMPAPR